VRVVKSAVVLGGGMIGAVIARDLASDPEFEVTVVDRRPEGLARIAQDGRVKTRVANLAVAVEVRQAIAGAQVAVGALSSSIGFATLRTVIEAGVPYTDVSFMAENPLELDALARSRGVTAVVDCGVAPGISNLIAGHAAHRLAPCERIDIFVGGLPLDRRWPFEYKAGFAPVDVIEEYTRPARLVEHGQVVVREALTEPEPLDFPGIGTLEAFNTDGLRSLTRTLKVPHMREKTLRYPGHIEIMRVFRHLGLFSSSPIEVAGQKVRPLDVTQALLFPLWQFGEGEADVTILRVEAWGRDGGRAARLRFDLCDRYDPETGLRSIARTTAFPVAIIARMVARGQFGPGVLPPELLAREAGVLDELMAELKRRRVACTMAIEPV
jgi:saccharopine dehydrogenase-like NADP-dependent oxidoreductase